MKKNICDCQFTRTSKHDFSDVVNEFLLFARACSISSEFIPGSSGNMKLKCLQLPLNSGFQRST